VVVALLIRFGTPLVDKLGPTRLGALSRIIGFKAYSRSLRRADPVRLVL
jgi:hypothetical protein